MTAVLNGPFGQIALGASPFTIGCTPDNQLVVSDSKVSSHHAEIRSQGQDNALIDLGSTDGTFLNEQRLDAQVPGQLHTGDIIRIGDMRFTYEMPGISSIESTAYGGSPQASEPGYPPSVAAPSAVAAGYEFYQQATYPPSASYPDAPATYGSEAQPVAYQPTPAGSEPAIYPPSAPYPGAPVPVPAQPGRRRGLWIILGAIAALVVIGLILFGAIAYVNRPTPTRSMNAFCNALKSGDYQTAYNQLSSSAQSQQSEAQFVAGYTSNLGLGKITNCTVTNIDDAAGTGTTSNTFASGSTLIYDYILVNEGGTWKINSQQSRSTPTLILYTYCDAINRGDYPTAYNQLSSTAQSQQSEAQFGANFGPGQLTSCTVDQLNDAAGTGTIIYASKSGNKLTADFTLVKESGTWKINSRQLRSSPTLTLLTYCGALESGNYLTAYNQLSSRLQSQISEARFAASFRSGQLADCVVSNVNDAAGMGTITYTLSGYKFTVDYILVNEGGTWKINSQQLRSTPTLTLLTFCSALEIRNYQLAYDQLSRSQQRQQSEVQFANLFIPNPVTNCIVSNVDDTAGTGSIRKTYADGSSNVTDYTLIERMGPGRLTPDGYVRRLPGGRFASLPGFTRYIRTVRAPLPTFSPRGG